MVRVVNPWESVNCTLILLVIRVIVKDSTMIHSSNLFASTLIQQHPPTSQIFFARPNRQSPSLGWLLFLRKNPPSSLLGLKLGAHISTVQIGHITFIIHTVITAWFSTIFILPRNDMGPWTFESSDSMKSFGFFRSPNLKAQNGQIPTVQHECRPDVTAIVWLLSWSQKSHVFNFLLIFQKHFFFTIHLRWKRKHAMPSRSFVSGSNWRSQLIAMTGAYLANMTNHTSWTCEFVELRIPFSINIRILLTHGCVFCYFCKFVSYCFRDIANNNKTELLLYTPQCVVSLCVSNHGRCGVWDWISRVTRIWLLKSLPIAVEWSDHQQGSVLFFWGGRGTFKK